MCLPMSDKSPRILDVGRCEDIFSRIFNKVEEPDKIPKCMKRDVSILSQTTNSHSVSIKKVDTQMGDISSHLNRRQQQGFPNDTMPNPKSET